MIKGGGDEAGEDEACAAQEGPGEAREVREEEDGHAEEEARDVEDPEVAHGVVVGGEGLVVEGDRAFFLLFFFTML